MTEVPPARFQPDGRIDLGGFGRLTRVPAIRVGVEDGGTGALMDYSISDVRGFVDPAALEEVDAILAEAGFPPARPERVDVGRGASGAGIAIEILDTIDKVGGVAAAVLLAATAIRRVLRAVNKRLGHATTISLGAAEYLAAADLVGKVGDEAVRLVGSGDVSSRSADASFIGGDAYWVVLAAAGSLHHFQVDCFGRVTYLGEAPAVPPHWDPPPEIDDAGDATY